MYVENAETAQCASVHQAAGPLDQWEPTQPLGGIVQPFQIPNYLNMVSSE